MSCIIASVIYSLAFQVSVDSLILMSSSLNAVQHEQFLKELSPAMKITGENKQIFFETIKPFSRDSMNKLKAYFSKIQFSDSSPMAKLLPNTQDLKDLQNFFLCHFAFSVGKTAPTVITISVASAGKVLLLENSSDLSRYSDLKFKSTKSTHNLQQLNNYARSAAAAVLSKLKKSAFQEMENQNLVMEAGYVHDELEYHVEVKGIDDPDAVPTVFVQCLVAVAWKPLSFGAKLNRIITSVLPKTKQKAVTPN